MHTENKIINQLEQLNALRQTWKNENKKVVFTNGCFDIVHLGHIDYLEKARKLGDKLIIGLNTDESIKKLKGESRPINDAYARSRMLAAFEFVDAVILFGEETPFDLINSLLPDVLVKGDDYTVETIVGAKEVLANGGTVETVALVSGYSTSNIINKIKTE